MGTFGSMSFAGAVRPPLPARYNVAKKITSKTCLRPIVRVYYDHHVQPGLDQLRVGIVNHPYNRTHGRRRESARLGTQLTCYYGWVEILRICGQPPVSLRALHFELVVHIVIKPLLAAGSRFRSTSGFRSRPSCLASPVYCNSVPPPLWALQKPMTCRSLSFRVRPKCVSTYPAIADKNTCSPRCACRFSLLLRCLLKMSSLAVSW
ncbi:hypothetical protein BAUCODRAFT_535861 [Baudoinia panamericana UAMH 10762]|uniref:Uncharacterized protein n=1 Tax=Baudoinia panamericana (strain UAMH 10762) TaxID=717646 RepID=M2N893_BAUPA|nr:uncharacterized protein BAUCODRAFT_535861 [Baudoinia panamericana UAMH 10762]EMC95314.1 hypothetical protein BAUCODRAFT_535861 [Baudoinia panamericana UAMH 10762]